MPSIVGLLEQHERAARRRVDGLREEADRIQAELAAGAGENGSGSEGLPLRWVVILLASLIGGAAVGRAEGLGAGVTVAIALAGFLHLVMRS
ncbi:hypothetical protein GCM10017744_078490 [Streptomyces antimycoticus]|uniref:Uncharacterized protein n=1 Tax=Streptomyces antimycoticus TaxID=68175 RepID=A0A4D4K522_9ACTN|nr:hypothetical protein [Streptomyces antimycoticus]GDY41409.1 hypothetical protein SANT12839_022910 [Streptomyces antimycoticus]